MKEAKTRMSDHYYTADPTSAHKPCELRFAYRGADIRLETDSGVFSRTEIDRGTEVLLSALPEPLEGDILDIGCGYGAIGIAVGKRYPACRITMSDVNRRACGLAADNAKLNAVAAGVTESDGYQALGDKQFDYILQNPPIRAGKAAIYAMFGEAAARLKPGGSLWLVIRKQQGAASAMAYLQTLYQSVTAVEKKSGFWVIQCTQPINTKGALTDDI